MPSTTGYSRAQPRQRRAPSMRSPSSMRSRLETSSENSSSPRSVRFLQAGQTSGSSSGRSRRVPLPHLRQQLLRGGIVGPHQERVADDALRFPARAAVLLALPALPLLARLAEQPFHLRAQLAGAVGIEERRARLDAGGGVPQIGR